MGPQTFNTAWLEPKGFNQPHELDLDETYDLVEKINIAQEQIGIIASIGGKSKLMKGNQALQHGGLT